ncbi:MAG: hypothetical protein AAF554_09345 [Bacteroidota bacterium]
MKSFKNIVSVLLICLGSTVMAQETYEDTFGGFVIDLYEGMQPVPKKHDAVLGLKNSSYSIIIQMNEDEMDVEKAYARCVDNLIASGMSEMKQKVGHRKMLVNGNMARMGTYESAFETNGIEVTLIGAAFSIALEENTLSVLAIMSPKVYENSLKEFEKSIFSIRLPNQELTGTSQVEDWDITLKEINKSIPKEEVTETVATSTKPTAVNFGGVSFMLPPGWAEQPKNRSDPDNFIGRLTKTVDGVEVIVMGLKGLIWNKKRANQVAAEVVKQVFPDGVLEKALEINLTNNKKGTLYKYTGNAIAEGEEVRMATISVVQKVGKQFLVYFMALPDGPTEDLERDIIAIANSAK